MKTIVLKGLIWLTIAVVLILSVDAFLTIYKTIIFRDGIDKSFDFMAVLLVCCVFLVVTALTGLGALAVALRRSFLFSANTSLGTALVIGFTFLFANAVPTSEWINTALASKSESVAVCVFLCGVLLWMTWGELE